jgi:preprotein translocase subunit SecA
MSVGQQDPLVEYRRRGQLLFESMQATLRHDVIRAVFHAQPVDQDELDRVIETDLTRAARGSVDNASRITAAETEFEAADFKDKREDVEAKKKQVVQRKKARKTERKRKTAARRKK